MTLTTDIMAVPVFTLRKTQTNKNKSGRDLGYVKKQFISMATVKHCGNNSRYKFHPYALYT